MVCFTFQFSVFELVKELPFALPSQIRIALPRPTTLLTLSKATSKTSMFNHRAYIMYHSLEISFINANTEVKSTGAD